jgi:hypothetical protein
MNKFDYQIVTDTNQWVGGGSDSTENEIKEEVENIKNRLKENGDEVMELIVFKAPKITQNTYIINHG